MCNYFLINDMASTSQSECVWHSDTSVSVLNMGLIPLRSSGGTELDNYISWSIVEMWLPRDIGRAFSRRAKNTAKLSQAWTGCLDLLMLRNACKDFRRENCGLQGNSNVNNLDKDKSWDFELTPRKYLIRTYADRTKIQTSFDDLGT